LISGIAGTFLIHFYEEYLLVTKIMSIFALYNVNKHSMLRQKREKSGTGICHVMQGKESKTCPYDSRTLCKPHALVPDRCANDPRAEADEACLGQIYLGHPAPDSRCGQYNLFPKQAGTEVECTAHLELFERFDNPTVLFKTVIKAACKEFSVHHMVLRNDLYIYILRL